MLTKLKERQGFSNPHLTNLISIVLDMQNSSTRRRKIFAPNITEFIVCGSTPVETLRSRSTKGH